MKLTSHVGRNTRAAVVAATTLVGFFAWISPGFGASSTTDAKPSTGRYAALDKLPDWSGHWAAMAALTVGPAAAAAAGQDGGIVPFTTRYLALRAKAKIVDGDVTGGNMVKCWPSGMPGMMRHGTLFEFYFTPGLVSILFENGEIRRIYTDGRSHPPGAAPTNNWSGHSTGHWDGNTLVVDTVGIKPDAELFIAGDLHVTSQTHVIERMTRTDAKTLRVETTVIDPEIFTKPYRYTNVYETVDVEMPDADNCPAYTRENGETVDLTPPSAPK